MIILTLITAVVLSSAVTSAIIKKKYSSRTNVLSADFEYLKKQAEDISEIRKFRHDYKNQLSGLQILLSAGEYEKASAYLAEINNNFVLATEKTQIYSDNTLIDAILHNFACKCAANGISFDACVTVLDNKLSLTDLQICTLFSNIADNAYEAALSYSNDNIKSFISFSSSLREKWLIITVENSFDGILQTDSANNLITRKKNDAKHHGIGLKSIQAIINTIDGAQIKIEPDSENEIFSLRLIFPI